MTPEQEQFLGVMLRGMRFFGRAFLVMWLAICSVFVAVAGWMLANAVSAADSSQIGLAAGMLAASVCFACVGYVFIRFWLGSLDRIRGQVTPCLPAPTEPEQLTNEPTFGDQPSSKLMSTSVHIGLQMVASVVGMVLAAVAFFFIVTRLELTTMWATITVGMLGAGATVVSRMVTWLIPAKCPQCSGPTYCRGSRPIRFECRRCGHLHNTGISVTSNNTPT